MNRQHEVKLNSFSGTSQVAITGRYGFAQDTDTDITRSYDVEVLRYEDDEKEPDYRNSDPRMPEIQRWGRAPLHTSRRYDGYNMPLNAVDFKVNIPNGSVMKQIKELDFRPSAATNSLSCYPVLQRRIIPYLCPPQTISNVETDYLTTSSVTAANVSNSQGLPPPVVEWDPRFLGHFVLTQLAGADGLVNAWSLDKVGVHPNASIDFSYDQFVTTRKTLLLNYDAATDGYVFNEDSDLIVRIRGTSFKDTTAAGVPLAALPGDFFFRIDNNQQVGAQGAPHQFDLFLNPFNEFGRTEEGPVGAAAVPFAAGGAPSVHFLKLVLWRRAGPLFQSRVCDNAGAISAANQLALVAAGGVAGGAQARVRASITELVLWLRRPRIARGQKKTYSYTPAETGFMNYYRKEVGGAVQVHDLTNFGEFDGFKQKQVQTLGSFRVRFTRWNANAGVTTATVRTLGELEITLDDQVLFDYIHDLAGVRAVTREHTLILRTGPPLCKGGPPAAFPTSVQQLAGQGALGSAHRGRMILRFQQRHASYVPATRTMIFSRYGALHAALGNLGTQQLVTIAGNGAQTFPQGVPYLCFEHDLYPRPNEFGGAGQPVAQVADVRAAATGWLLAPQGAAVANVANSQGNRIVSMLRHHRNAAEEYAWEGMRQSLHPAVAGEFNNEVVGAAAVNDPITFNSGFRTLFVRSNVIADRVRDFFYHPVKNIITAAGGGPIVNGVETNIAYFAALGGPARQQIIADFNAEDELLNRLHTMMSGAVETDIPLFEDVNHPTTFRNQISGVSKTEPLLGFMSGMSTYQVSKIWNPVKSYPILLQDYTYRIVEDAFKPQFFGTSAPGFSTISINNNANQVPNTLLRITRTGETTLNIRERRNQDQATKSLSTINYYYPLIEETTSFTSNPVVDGGQNIDCEVQLLSEYGPCDYIFVYCERKLDYRQTFYITRYPTIIGLDLEFVYNGKRLCSYLLNETELWKATRKNHHILQSTKDLKLKEGAVLLTRDDIGFWGIDNFKKSDLLELRVHATVRQHPRDPAGEPVVSYNARLNSQVKLTVALIHPDRIFISGTSRAISFNKIK